MEIKPLQEVKIDVSFMQELAELPAPDEADTEESNPVVFELLDENGNLTEE